MPMAFAVGIDLGTTNTAVAAVRDGVAMTLADGQGDRLLASVVSMTPSGSVLVGRPALDRRITDAENTVYSIKRLIGRSWDAPDVQKARATLPFKLEEGPKGSVHVAVRGETFSLSEISAFVLRQAKAVAEAALGSPVERAVITVPANFNDLQRAATKTAGRLAGLEVLRILNEPTAAALAYGPQGASRERVAVYDLGGGTFDITVLDLVDNVFEVIATAGDTALGGDDIDLVVANRMADDLQKRYRFDARSTPTELSRLRIIAEEMKRALSTKAEHAVSPDDLARADGGAPPTWRFRMTRPELEWASLALIDRTLAVCQQALDAAGATAAEIDRVVLVGGVTRMPMVARKVEQFFGRAPVVKINPDEVVALGAAIQAELLDRSRARRTGDPVHPQISPESVVEPIPDEGASAAGPPDVPNLPVILPKRRPPVPVSVAPREAPPSPFKTEFPPSPFKTEFLPGRNARALVFDVPEPKDALPFEIELGTLVRAPRPPPAPNPPPAAPMRPPVSVGPPILPSRDAPPAHGPPVLPSRAAPPPDVSPVSVATAPSPPISRAAEAPPTRRAPLLIDVTPLSLNVETVGGFCDVLIDANTPVPCDRTRSFATASDGQTTVRVRVAQGESRRFDDNTFLGEVELSGVPAAPRGEAPIAVTFEIDADGILNVRAREMKTGRETVAQIALAGTETNPAEIQAMRDRQAKHPLVDPR
jgi:molecular chaperone DnaK